MDLRRNIYLSKPISATPGFGDNIDNEDGYVSSYQFCRTYHAFVNSFQEIMNYLELQYDDILTKQSRIKRNPRFRDNRVHALLYFIPPCVSATIPCSFTSRV